LSNDSEVRKEIDLYLERLLTLQYQASSYVSHPNTKGDLRENFLKQTIEGEFPLLRLEKGVVEKKRGSQKQLDLIWLKPNARVGLFHCYDIADCRLIIEIKSTAKKNDMEALNKIAGTYKTMEHTLPNLKVGMFCYSTNVQKKTFLHKLGFDYDSEIDAYSGYSKDIYPQIDFFFSLDIHDDESTGDEQKPYFVYRDNNKSNVLILESPAITKFLNLFKQEL